MEDVVSVFICRDGRDIGISMNEYEDEQRRFTDNVKVNRHIGAVTVNDEWTTKFVSEPEHLAGLCTYVKSQLAQEWQQLGI